MEKISVTLNVSKIDKSKILERTYKNKDGQDITEKFYKFDLVPTKEQKFISEGKDWVLKKTHFGAETQTKEEKEVKKPTNYVAEGMIFYKKEDHSAIDPMTGVDLNKDNHF